MDKKANIPMIVFCLISAIISTICFVNYKPLLGRKLFTAHLLNSNSLGLFYNDRYTIYKEFKAVDRASKYIDEKNPLLLLGGYEDYRGVYYAKHSTYYKYIKFYDDKTVITVSTNIQPDQALAWIDQRIEYVPKGKYEIDDEGIKFTTLQIDQNGNQSVVDYKGFKKRGKLFLHSYSQNTKNKSFFIYKLKQ